MPDRVAQSDAGDQFVRCALHVGARYAIPFASNHCFLHRETLPFNRTATTPEDVRRRYSSMAARAGVESECVVMPPGSSWSDRDGFSLRHFDFAAREEYIESLLKKHRSKLESCYQQEDAAGADFESFRDYFERLISALPSLLRRTLAPIVFRTRDAAGEHHWLVDARRAAVEQLRQVPPGCAVCESHPAVLRDCARNRMFSVWTASKRLKILLPNAKALIGVQRWFTILDLYELDVFPLGRNLSHRSLAIRARRWREPLELARLLMRRVLLRRPLTVATLYPVKAI